MKMIIAMKISILGLSFATNILSVWKINACIHTEDLGLLTYSFYSSHIAVVLMTVNFFSYELVCTLDSFLAFHSYICKNNISLLEDYPFRIWSFMWHKTTQLTNLSFHEAWGGFKCSQS